MLKTLLHKTLLTAIAILLGGWAVVAQHHVVKGTALSFTADKNTAIDFRWEIYNVDKGRTEYNLTSNTNISEEYTFNTEGDFKVKAYPVDKSSRCLGEPISIDITVIGTPPTIVFDDLSDAYACSSNNGDNSRAEINCTVYYTGPKPWTFKYSVDREPAVMPAGADNITGSSFDFVVSIENLTGRPIDSEIMIVEAASISGLKVPEDIDEHTNEIKILPLPDTKFVDFETLVIAGNLQSFTANILRHDANTYEIIAPDGASVLNEETSFLADDLHSELTFDIQWGSSTGNKQVKLIEKNGFNCSGDTIYADINVVEYIDFSVTMDASINACVKDIVVLSPEVRSSSDQEFTYFWNTGDTDSTLEVTETGTYFVEVTGEGLNAKTKKSTIDVLFNPLPIVDLGLDTNLPEGESITLDAGTSDGSSYLWNDGSENQTLNITAGGEYWVQITDNNGCINRDTIEIAEGNVLSVEMRDYLEICEGETSYVSPTVNIDEVTYNWIPGGETTSGIYVSKKGKYCVEVSDQEDNKETVCIDVVINPAPVVDLGDDVKLDVGEVVDLDAGNDGVSYVWSVDDIVAINEISSTLAVSSTGKYSVEVMGSNDCVGRDTTNVYSKGRRYLPTGFSPNGDGRNDELKVLRYDNVKAITFIIHNRGGQKIFQSNRLDIGWDGTYKGELQRMDTYVYFLRVTLDDNRIEEQRGEVTLLR